MTYSTKAGNWQKDIGWEIIDSWVEEAGGLTINGGNISMDQIRQRCIELCGSAPSKGSISPHYSITVSNKAQARQTATRNTLRGKIQRALQVARREERERAKNPPQKRTNNYKSWREKFRVSLKDFRRNTSRGEEMNVDHYIENLKERGELSPNEDVVTCYICKEDFNPSIDNWHLDHKVPKSKGGTCDPDNLSIVHAQCNQAKGNMSMQDFKKLCKKVI